MQQVFAYLEICITLKKIHVKCLILQIDFIKLTVKEMYFFKFI